MKKLIIILTALIMLVSAAGCGYDMYKADEPAASEPPMYGAGDGAVNDGDGYIGNEQASDPAGDTVPETTLLDTAEPEQTVKPGM